MLPLPSPWPPPRAIPSLEASVVQELSEVKFSKEAVGTCWVILGHGAREATGLLMLAGALGYWLDLSAGFLVLEMETITATLKGSP